jgi:hypothetical protein
MCTVLLPPVGYPITVNKYIIRLTDVLKITEWIQCLLPLSVETHVDVNVPFVMFLSVTIIAKEVSLPCSEAFCNYCFGHAREIFIEPMKWLSVVERAWSWIHRLHHLSAELPTTTDHWPLVSIAACHRQRFYWRREWKILSRNFNTVFVL